MRIVRNDKCKELLQTDKFVRWQVGDDGRKIILKLNKFWRDIMVRDQLHWGGGSVARNSQVKLNNFHFIRSVFFQLLPLSRWLSLYISEYPQDIVRLLVTHLVLSEQTSAWRSEFIVFNFLNFQYGNLWIFYLNHFNSLFVHVLQRLEHRRHHLAVKLTLEIKMQINKDVKNQTCLFSIIAPPTFNLHATLETQLKQFPYYQIF